MKQLSFFVMFLSCMLPRHASAWIIPEVIPGEPTRYAESTVDATASQLPAGYFGLNPRDVWLKLPPLFHAKEEFETTESYKNRLSNGVSSKLIGEVKASDILTMSKAIEPGFMKYDADKGTLSVSLQFSVNAFRGSLLSGPPTISFADSKIELGTYVGSNAYGSETTVFKSRSQNFVVEFQNFKDFGIKDKKIGYSSFPPESVDRVLTLTPERAKEAKENMRALVFFTLLPPYALYEEYSSINSPDSFWGV